MPQKRKKIPKDKLACWTAVDNTDDKKVICVEKWPGYRKEKRKRKKKKSTRKVLVQAPRKNALLRAAASVLKKYRKPHKKKTKSHRVSKESVAAAEMEIPNVLDELLDMEDARQITPLRQKVVATYGKTGIKTTMNVGLPHLKPTSNRAQLMQKYAPI